MRVFVIRRRSLRRAFLLSVQLFLALLYPAPAPAVPASAPASGVALPAVMYHSLLRDSARAGDYVLSPQTLEEDILFLKERGYVPVTVSQAASYVLYGTPLPEKPILLTLDDGFLNNLTYLPDILQRTDACVTVAVVGQYTEQYTLNPDPNPNYAYLTWEDVRALYDTGRVEIACHSWAFHNLSPRRGASQLQGESDEQYRQALLSDTSRLQNTLLERCGLTCSVYAYPFGLSSPGSDGILRQAGFTATLSCTQRVSTITPGDPGCLCSLGRFNRPAGLSSRDFFARMGIS